MTGHRNLYVSAVLIMVSCVHMTQAAAPNPIEFMSQVAKGVETLGKNTLCVADLGTNPEIVAKAYQACDKAVAGIRANTDGPFSEEKFASLVRVLIDDTSVAMRAIDPRCSDVSNYCSAADPPPAAKTLAELGKSLELMGTTLACLIADPKPEVLAQIPVIIGAAIHKIAQNEDAYKTSVAILLPEIVTIAFGFQKLSSSCSNVVNNCLRQRR